MATISGNNAGSTQLTTVTKTDTSTVPLSENTVVTTSGNATTTTKTQTFLVGETSAMFMRAKTVVFTAQGLKPNTRYYPFFNKVYVGAFCSTVSGQQSSNVVTNSQGDVVGNFFLPAGTFTTGTHTFELVDNILDDGVNPISADPLYGSASATYEAKGILKLLQTQVTETTVVTEPPNTNSNNSNNSNVPAPKPSLCEEWQFVYEISHTDKQTLSVVTATTAQPSSSGITFPNGTVTSSIVYQGVTPSSGMYSHKFAFSVQTKRRVTVTHIGKADTPRADLATFRPSGLVLNDTITIVTPWTRVRDSIACPTSLGIQAPKRVDPLAQSFLVDGVSHPQGVFATSIDAFFKTVDKSAPVILELREMSNGLPASTILPGGTVVVPGYATAQSTDGSLPTTFRFSQPIFLKPNTEYCFVLKSSSLGYNAWCSRVGNRDIATGQVIDTQPFSGTLFKSENDSTWVPDSYEDIKFELRVAQFQITTSGGIPLVGDLVFRPQIDTGADVTAGAFVVGKQYTIKTLGTTDFTLIGAPRNQVGTVFVSTGVGSGTGTVVEGTNNYYASARKLPLSYISTSHGNDPLVTVRVPRHGLQDNDLILITNIAQPVGDTYNNIDYRALQNQFQVTVIDEDTIQFQVIGSNADRTGALAVVDTTAAIDTTPPVTVDGIMYVETPTVFNTTELIPSTYPGMIALPPAPLTPTIVSAGTFTIYTNVISHEVLIDYLATELSGTNIDERIRMVTADYIMPLEMDIDRDGDFHKFAEPRLLASPRNEDLRTIDDSLLTRLRLTSTNKDISPIVDITGMSLMVKTHRIDNQNEEITVLLDDGAIESDFNDPTRNSEITAGSGLAAAKYKSTVNRTNDYYNQIIVFVVGNCPNPAAIDAYIRTSADESTHMDRQWKWMSVNGVFGTAFPTTGNDNKALKEWMYVFDADEYFNVYDIKLVMRSTNSSVVPKIYGVRAITEKV
jgi:hypothetical protein